MIHCAVVKSVTYFPYMYFSIFGIFYLFFLYAFFLAKIMCSKLAKKHQKRAEEFSRQRNFF